MSSISFVVNGVIMLIAGLTFGWTYALYSMITIFVSSRVTDVVFTKQKKMRRPWLLQAVQIRLSRKILGCIEGATMINGAEEL